MRLTIFEAIETGLLQIPFHPDNPFLFCLFWLCFFISVIVQAVLFQHCKGYGKWGFIYFPRSDLSAARLPARSSPAGISSHSCCSGSCS